MADPTGFVGARSGGRTSHSAINAHISATYGSGDLARAKNFAAWSKLAHSKRGLCDLSHQTVVK